MSLKLENISFYYENFSLDVDISVKNGEFISILGPSGSGKTTLLRILAGFMPPATGNIMLSGRNITGLQTSARNIGMVFQDYALFPHLDVRGNISYGLKIKKMSRQQIDMRVADLLGLVGLNGYEKRRIDELSGGEKQRIALARAIAPEPELLLFDEPLSALDMKLRKSLRREIRRIQQRLGFTAVYVTHDQEEAMSVSDRIAVMNGGRIIQEGSPEEIYNHPANYFTADFIGVMNRLSLEHELMFRPEACTLIDDKNMPGRSDLVIEVRLETLEYSGGFYVCEAASKNGERIIFYSDRALTPGSDFKIMVKSDNLISCS